MDRKYFGTDGIRGKVGQFPITPEFILKLGQAIGKSLAMHGGTEVVIGKDTRISGYMFESLLEAGLASSGVNVQLLGPMPTPAIAYLTRTLGADIGIVISASHNPYEDNGIKFFSHKGMKLDDATELEIEKYIDSQIEMVPSANLGKAKRVNDAPGRYIEFCKGTFPRQFDLRGLKIVVDCANGATYHIAPSVFRELGAKVVVLNNQPDGLNINVKAGSTHPAKMAAAVLEQDADLGIAFDGDGDRVICVDHEGTVVDGDDLLYVMATNRPQGKPEGVVGTLMTNLGIEHAFTEAGISFERAAVGDRYVLEKMLQHGWTLGGESSGHIICLDQQSTGDGIVAALQVLAAMRHRDGKLQELCTSLQKYPQQMINVTVANGKDIVALPAITEAVAEAEQILAQNGRVLLRASGTEPLVRVMVEGEDAVLIRKTAEKLAAIVEKSAKGH